MTLTNGTREGHRVLADKSLLETEELRSELRIVGLEPVTRGGEFVHTAPHLSPSLFLFLSLDKEMRLAHDRQ